MVYGTALAFSQKQRPLIRCREEKRRWWPRQPGFVAVFDWIHRTETEIRVSWSIFKGLNCRTLWGRKNYEPDTILRVYQGYWPVAQYWSVLGSCCYSGMLCTEVQFDMIHAGHRFSITSIGSLQLACSTSNHIVIQQLAMRHKGNAYTVKRPGA